MMKNMHGPLLSFTCQVEISANLFLGNHIYSDHF